MHAYGLVHDRHDPRDLRFSVVANESLATLELPPSVDLRPLCSPVRDQTQLGCCGGFASVTGLRESLLLQTHGESFQVLSPLFEYYWARVKEHTVDRDAGMQIRDALKVLAKFGAALEQDWPYDIARFTERPPPFAIARAAAYRIQHYHRIHNLIEIKQSLVLNRPVVIGIEVWSSFDSPEVAASGVVPMPNRDVERYGGGHAVAVCGFDDRTRTFLVKNSWGTGWGQAGYFQLPYDFCRPDLGLLMDAWSGSL